MGIDEKAKLANYEEDKTWCAKNRQLKTALDTICDLLGIEFGSITIRFHDGKWSPKVQIEKRLFEDVND